MRLPGLKNATIDEQKVRSYLLSIAHPTGRHKAVWLMRHGFEVAQPEALVEAIRRHAAAHEVARVEDSPFGKRYVLEGPLMTPDGHNPRVRAVWFIEGGEEAPRFVTLYPLRRSVR